MSFFRRPDELTVSEDYTGDETTTDDSEDGSEHELGVRTIRKVKTSDTLSSTQSFSREDPPSTAVAFPSVPRLTTGHRLNSQEILTRAALERSFIFEALAELLQTGTNGPYTKDHPEVKALAESKYRQVTDLLHQGGLLKQETTQESDLRPAFRAGLDLLSNTATNARAIASSGAASGQTQSIELFDPAPRQQSIDLSDSSLIRINQMLEASTRFTNSLPRAIWENLGHPLFRRSRYAETFKQLQLLGKGGFGKVYCVQHRLTQNEYAVKLIPVSAARMRKIHERGKEELDTLYKEVRVLSRLDHPNIVRFYDGWLEYSAMEMTAGLSERIKDVILDDVSSDDERHASPPPPPRKSPNIERHPVRKPYSGPTGLEESSLGTSTGLESEDRSLSESWPNDNPSVSKMEPASSARIDFATTESVPDVAADIRILKNGPTHLGSSLAIKDKHGDERFGQPQLILYIQMGLHPLTLADFLMSQPSAIEAQRPGHCFHTRHSLLILLELLDGVIYMHARGIAHGDLKPSNIFLSISHDTADAKAPLLPDCSECDPSVHHGPMSVRIGDFGLASEIAKPEGPWQEATQTSKAVGTTLYRPLVNTGEGGEGLDVYALGIIAVELLTPFQTRMERHDVLNRVKSGQHTVDCGSKLDGNFAPFATLLADMVERDPARRPTCTKVRDCIRNLLTNKISAHGEQRNRATIGTLHSKNSS